jgi:(1->4)-alpha-D-glucan 1-alpha-D-glucosylmutase
MILSSSPGNPFMKEFEAFQKKISYFGMFNSLSQTLLKITCPGIPDFYQGTEIWDFSLVDPDNRRPVDFKLREELLAGLKKRMEMSGADLREFVKELVREWKDGAVKLYVTYVALNYRRKNHQLFTDGVYLPLVGGGDYGEHVCAFARRREEKAVLVIVPRFLTRIIKTTDEAPPGPQVWRDAWVDLTDEISGNHFRNIFTNETVEKAEMNGHGKLLLAEIFADFPVAVLERV